MPDGSPQNTAPDAALTDALNAHAASLMADSDGPAFRSLVYQIECPDRGLKISGAAGTARPDTREAAQSYMPFHTASIAKTLTAIGVLQLLERGLLGEAGLETKFADTGVFDRMLTERLLSVEGQSVGRDITINHLLRHLSGMRDAMVDDADICSADVGGPAPKSLIGRIFTDLSRAGKHWDIWDPAHQGIRDAGTVNFYLNNDGVAAAGLAEPGQLFHYSDTGYVLLGLLIEHLSGLSLEDYYRQKIFDRLGMPASYLAYRSDPDLGPARTPEMEAWALDIPCLTSGMSLSFDWAGGGLVCNCADLVSLLRGVQEGLCFERPETRDLMMDWQTPAGLKAPRRAVGRGLFLIEGGTDGLVGHSGAWGGKMFCDPATGVYFAGSVNQSAAPNTWFLPFVDIVNHYLAGRS